MPNLLFIARAKRTERRFDIIQLQFGSKPEAQTRLLNFQVVSEASQ